MKKSLNKIVVSLQIMLMLLSNVSVYANESSTKILSEDIKEATLQYYDAQNEEWKDVNVKKYYYIDENKNKVPIYILNKDTDKEIKIDSKNIEPIKDIKIYTILKNGYSTENRTNLQIENDAYLATHIALYWVINNKEPETIDKELRAIEIEENMAEDDENIETKTEKNEINEDKLDESPNIKVEIDQNQEENETEKEGKEDEENIQYRDNQKMDKNNIQEEETESIDTTKEILENENVLNKKEQQEQNVEIAVSKEEQQEENIEKVKNITELKEEHIENITTNENQQEVNIEKDLNENEESENSKEETINNKEQKNEEIIEDKNIGEKTEIKEETETRVNNEEKTKLETETVQSEEIEENIKLSKRGQEIITQIQSLVDMAYKEYEKQEIEKGKTQDIIAGGEEKEEVDNTENNNEPQKEQTDENKNEQETPKEDDLEEQAENVKNENSAEEENLKEDVPEENIEDTISEEIETSKQEAESEKQVEQETINNTLETENVQERENPKIKIECYTKNAINSNTEHEYEFKIENVGNTAVENLMFYDIISNEKEKISKIDTGTYNLETTYNIYYKTNKNASYKILKAELNSKENYNIDLNNINLEQDEYITEIKIEFGNIEKNFKNIKNLVIYTQTKENLKNETQIKNYAILEGNYNSYKMSEDIESASEIYNTLSKKRLPKTGY